MIVTDLVPTFSPPMTVVMTDIQASRLGGLRPVAKRAYCAGLEMYGDGGRREVFSRPRKDVWVWGSGIKEEDRVGKKAGRLKKRER